MITWATFIGAATGVVFGLMIGNHRDEVNQDRYHIVCQTKSDSARAFFEGFANELHH